jgi:hypothetical protein
MNKTSSHVSSENLQTILRSHFTQLYEKSVNSWENAIKDVEKIREKTEQYSDLYGTRRKYQRVLKKKVAKNGKEPAVKNDKEPVAKNDKEPAKRKYEVVTMTPDGEEVIEEEVKPFINPSREFINMIIVLTKSYMNECIDALNAIKYSHSTPISAVIEMMIDYIQSEKNKSICLGVLCLGNSGSNSGFLSSLFSEFGVTKFINPTPNELINHLMGVYTQFIYMIMNKMVVSKLNNIKSVSSLDHFKYMIIEIFSLKIEQSAQAVVSIFLTEFVTKLQDEKKAADISRKENIERKAAEKRALEEQAAEEKRKNGDNDEDAHQEQSDADQESDAVDDDDEDEDEEVNHYSPPVTRSMTRMQRNIDDVIETPVETPTARPRRKAQ